jgi:hypothetical protein
VRIWCPVACPGVVVSSISQGIIRIAGEVRVGYGTLPVSVDVMREAAIGRCTGEYLAS